MDVFYFGQDSRQLFGALARPPGPIREGIVLVPPFGDEMVCTYSRLSRWSKALAAEGTAVLRYHPYGTGESAGAQAEVTVEGAALDAAAAVTRLRELGATKVGVVGLRFGGNVVARAAAAMKADFAVLWSPVTSLAQHLSEILRQRVAAEMVNQIERKTTVKAMLEQLEGGHAVDVLGHEISPALHREMTASKSLPDEPPAPRVLWLARPPEAPKAEATVAAWRQRGARVDLEVRPEIVFWETFSATMPDQFIAATRSFLREGA